jgi:VanZ family protein
MSKTRHNVTAARRNRVLLGALALLIAYGSLYPFDVATPEPGALRGLFSNWTLTTARGDMLGNLALFVLWGVAGMMTVAPRRGMWRAVAFTVVAGFALAFGCQIAQVWVPSRSASLADVFWNMAGVAVGLLLGRQALKHLGTSTTDMSLPLVPTCLLGAWLFYYWLPLVPSIDLQLLKDNLNRSLTSAGHFASVLAIPAFVSC